MNIVTSVIESTTPRNSLTIVVVEKHTDIHGIEYSYSYIADNGHDTQASLSEHATQISDQLVQTEIEDAIQSFYDGLDPLHIDMGGWYNKADTFYQTWDELAAASTIPFLASPDQLDLLYIQYTSRISTNDKKDIWGMTNKEVSSVSGDIQIAIDTSASLASYTPYFDEDGVKV